MHLVDEIANQKTSGRWLSMLGFLAYDSPFYLSVTTYSINAEFVCVSILVQTPLLSMVAEMKVASEIDDTELSMPSVGDEFTQVLVEPAPVLATQITILFVWNALIYHPMY